MSEKAKKVEKQQPPRKHADTSVFDWRESARGDNLVSKREPAKSTLNSGRGTRQSKDPRECRADVLD